MLFNDSDPFFEAVKKGFLEIVKIFVKNGIDINQPDSSFILYIIRIIQFTMQLYMAILILLSIS